MTKPSSSDTIGEEPWLGDIDRDQFFYVLRPRGCQMPSHGSSPIVSDDDGFSQIKPLADAGYHVVVPDQRGYNLSDKPEGIENYTTRIPETRAAAPPKDRLSDRLKPCAASLRLFRSCETVLTERRLKQTGRRIDE
jgi:hypothetical protein